MKHRDNCADSTTSSIKHAKHLRRLEELMWALQGKQALLKMHEERLKHEKSFDDYDYVLKLRARIRGLQTRFNAMRPGAQNDF